MAGKSPYDRTRSPDGAFLDATLEMYARCRAGGQTIIAASEAAGISRKTGQALEQDSDVKARVLELRGDTQEFTGITLAGIMQRLVRNADDAHERGDIKASNDALKQLTDLVKQDAGQLAGKLRGMGPAAGTPKDVRSALRGELGPKLVLPTPKVEVIEAPADEPETVEAAHDDA